MSKSMTTEPEHSNISLLSEEILSNLYTVSMFNYVTGDDETKCIITSLKQGTTYFKHFLTSSDNIHHSFDINPHTKSIFNENELVESSNLIERYKTIHSYYESVLNKKTINIIYRNPIKKYLGAFAEDFLNDSIDNGYLRLITGFNTLEELIIYLCKENNISQDSDAFKFYKTDTKNFTEDWRIKNKIKYFHKPILELSLLIIEFIFKKYINNSTIYYTQHNNSYLSFIFSFISDNITYKLIDIDEINLYDFLKKENAKFKFRNSQATAVNEKANLWQTGVKEILYEKLSHIMIKTINNQSDLFKNSHMENLKNDMNLYRALKRNKNNYIL